MVKKTNIDAVNARLDNYMKEFAPKNRGERKVCADAIIKVLNDNGLPIPAEVRTEYSRYLNGDISLLEFTKVVADSESIKEILSKTD